MDKNCGIYAIINTVNGKLYIGQSTNIKRRITDHFALLRGNRHGFYYINKKRMGRIDHFQHAFNEYGEQAFEWKILECCKKEKLTEREQYYMDRYNSYNPHCGYNASTKAHSPIPTLEGIEKARLSQLGRKCTVEARERMSNAQKGKKRRLGQHHTEETKLKISMGNRGKKRTLEVREKYRQSHLGKKHTPEHAEKIRQANLGKKQPPEAVEKLRIRNLGNKYSAGKKRTPDHIEKQRQSNMKYKHLVKEWRLLHNQGNSFRQISKLYSNISKQTIRNYLVKHYPEGGINA